MEISWNFVSPKKWEPCIPYDLSHDACDVLTPFPPPPPRGQDRMTDGQTPVKILPSRN